MKGKLKIKPVDSFRMIRPSGMNHSPNGMSTFKTDYQIPNRQRVTIDDERLTVDLSNDWTIQNSRWAGFITVQLVDEATPMTTITVVQNRIREFEDRE